MERECEAYHRIASGYFHNTSGENGRQPVADAEAYHHEADVADAPAAGDERLEWEKK